MILLILLLLVLLLLVLLFFLSRNTVKSNNNLELIKDPGQLTTSQEVYFQLENTGLYFCWRKTSDNIHLELTENRDQSCKFKLDSNNSDYVQPYYFQAFRNDNRDREFAVRHQLDKIIFIRPPFQSNILIEVKPTEGGYHLASRVHMCGAYAHLTVNEKQLELDGRGPKAKFKVLLV